MSDAQDTAKSALVCLVFLTKIEDICDKCVSNNNYQQLDATIKTHPDNGVLSFVLVIDNAITATMKRQAKLNQDNFSDVIREYNRDVFNTKNDKLLILWLGILCKLTNNTDSCKSMKKNLYQYLEGLLRETFAKDNVFEKLFVSS